MAFEVVYIASSTEMNDTLKVTGIHLLTLTHLRVEYTLDGGAPIVRDYHFDNALNGVTLSMSNDPVVRYVMGNYNSYEATVIGTRRYRRTNINARRIPYDFGSDIHFGQDGRSLKDATPVTVVEIPRETDQEFHDRMMPFLHEAAWEFVQQAPRLDHELRNKRHKNSELRTKLPIGYLARELDRHAKGKGVMSREDTEALVRSVNREFMVSNAWYLHHFGHDVSKIARMHEKLRFELGDGSVDLKAESGEHAEGDFALLRTHFFGQALYNNSAYVRNRSLVFVDKE